MSLLSEFKSLAGGELTQPSVRQYFYVSFSGQGVDIPSNIGMFVQNFDLPNITLDEDGAIVIKNPRGTFKIPGDGLVIPESNSVSIDFLETEDPIIEKYFVPWLETVAAIRSAKKYPFPRATIYVDLLRASNPTAENKILTYEILQAFPTFITLPSLSQSPQTNNIRSVTFSFNRIKVTRK